MAKKKRFRHKKLIISISILLICGTIILSYSNNLNIPTWNKIYNYLNISKGTVDVNYEDYPLSVHILNVGKADAIYIKSNDKNILIDSGDTDTKDQVIQYLNNNKIQQFDLIIATHPHKDHIAGMDNIINTFPINRFIMPKLSETIIPTTKTYNSMINSLKDNNIAVESPIVGDNFKIGEINIDILGPIKEYDNLNNNSVIAKLAYKNTSFLFVGDAEKEAETDLISSGANLKSTVLKVGHHGSKTSTTQKFLNAVNPEYSVISVGPDSNNLPKDSIINRLKNNNIKTYRTDKSGTIIFTSDGDNINVFTEK